MELTIIRYTVPHNAHRTQLLVFKSSHPTVQRSDFETVDITDDLIGDPIDDPAVYHLLLLSRRIVFLLLI